MNQNAQRPILRAYLSPPVLTTLVIVALEVWASAMTWMYLAFGPVVGGITLFATAFPFAWSHWTRTGRALLASIVPFLLAAILRVLG